MTNEEVKAIVATPYVSPSRVVQHYLSNPQYLEEWLRAKGKEHAGQSNECQDCVMSRYIKEKLNAEGWQWEWVEFTHTHCEVGFDWEDISVKLPDWAQRFIKNIDAHNSEDEQLSVDFSGNLAKNILRVTINSMVEQVE